MKRLAPSQFARYMLGMFNLTDFEKYLIGVLREKLDPRLREALDSQISYGHRVDRVINENDDRLNHGGTIFYRRKRWMSKRTFPMLFPSNKRNELLAKITAVESDTQIEARFIISRGEFVGIEFFSPQKHFYPHGAYEVNP